MEAKGDFRSQTVTVNFDSGSICLALHKTIAFVFTRGLRRLHMPAVLTVLSSPGVSLQTQAQVLGVPGDSKRPNSGSLSLGRFVQLSDFIGATLIQLDMPTKPVTAIPLIWPLPGGGAVIATLGLLRNSSVFRYCKSWNWGIFYTPFLWCLQSTEMIFRRGRVISYLRGM